jgi:hypothetical protein
MHRRIALLNYRRNNILEELHVDPVEEKLGQYMDVKCWYSFLALLHIV